jgi:hypothetical protein
MNPRKLPVLVAAVGLTLAACGTSDSATSSTADAPEPVATDAAEPSAPAEGGSNDAPATEAPATPPASTEPAADAPTDSQATETAVTETAVTEPPSAAPTPAAIGGRALATSVEPASQFAANPFPDLVVDDIGRDGEANIANILPSDRPVLLWTWAPH